MTRVVAVVGPTAAGKSAAGVAIARILRGEVLNADSMQLYRGMDVGTAKLTEAERGGVRHHLLDVWDVTEAASVAEYQRLGRAVLDALAARGMAAVVVGGSGLYVSALLDRLDFPGTDPAVRARLEAELAVAGAPALHARLAGRDPAAAAAILPSNGRRIVRALEVIELTGAPFSAAPGLTAWEPAYDAVRLGLAPPFDGPDGLDARIAERVERMWEQGFVDEVRRLERVGLRAGVTASRALGYEQVLGYLDGRLAEADAKAEIVTATRRFARRQLRWFRRDPRISWYADPADLVAAAAELAPRGHSGATPECG